jgi:hypothetical protein
MKTKTSKKQARRYNPYAKEVRTSPKYRQRIERNAKKEYRRAKEKTKLLRQEDFIFSDYDD